MGINYTRIVYHCILRHKGFGSYNKYDKFMKIRRGYLSELQEIAKDHILKGLGIDMKSINKVDSRDSRLEILLGEEDIETDSEFLLKTFNDYLTIFLDRFNEFVDSGVDSGLRSNLVVSYEKGRIIMDFNNFNSWAFVAAYGKFLEKEINL